MPLVLADSTEGANTHLVSTTEQLQALLVLRADLTVQVSQLIHQLVPLEGGRLVVGLQVLFTIRSKAVEAGLDCLELLSSAEVTGNVPRPSAASITGRR